LVSTTTAAITSIINNSNIEAELTCYHQCNVCGIIFNCDETQRNCKLPFYNNKVRCSLCAIITSNDIGNGNSREMVRRFVAAGQGVGGFRS